MSSETILFPLATDESDIIMLFLALFLIAILIILLFLIFPVEFALFLTAAILFTLLWAIRESWLMQEGQKK
jgi:hypothetical protein